MPYTKTIELPEDVRNVLPEHAQHIFKEAFNSAYDEYEDPEKRRTDDSREEVAFKVAWSAVKKEYEKGADDKWQPKDE
jgi:cation transport regulator